MKTAQVRQADFGPAPSPAPIQDALQDEVQDFPLVIATLSATERQKTIALGIVILLIAATVAIAPFASRQVARVDAFIPVLQTVLSVADFITAALLFAQYSIQPQRALLALASGYLFSGAFAFLQTLAFPGAYAQAGLIGDPLNTPAWFFVLWHTTFPTAIFVYALSKNAKTTTALPSGVSVGTSIGITLGCVFAVTSGFTWVVTEKPELLPSLYITNVTLQTRFANQINVVLGLWGTAALVALWLRRRTILDLWLMVTLLAWMPNFMVAAIASSVRFTVGWYSARCFVLIGSSMLLTVLLTETTFLYSRLASAMILQRRERTNRLLSVDAVTAAIAHELNTPLGAIALNASTALSHLRSDPPELGEVDDILKDIEADSFRAGGIISSIRELSKKTIDRRAPTRVEDIARLILRLVHHDLLINEVSVATEFHDNVPGVHLDAIQLQQVLLNLIRNAIDAMGSVAPERRRLRITTSFDGDSTVLLSVQDSGLGIPLEDRKHIFDPFFTTKSAGMGLGLAICSAAIEKEGGQLRLIKSDSEGSIFEVALVALDSTPA
jgi:signal transduction histidine kinase